MKRLFLGFALVVGTTIAFVAPARRTGSARQHRRKAEAAAGALVAVAAEARPPAPPAGPMPRLPDGHPDMQGFWNPAGDHRY